MPDLRPRRAPTAAAAPAPPPPRPPAAGELARLVDFVAAARRLLVVTGAGVSTESGIPSYRDATGRWTARAPMTFRQFTSSDLARRRYWARSLVGWRRIAGARPNAGHRALARLEAAGRLHHLVTQNVDGLHGAAGSRRVIDLHGRLDRVECMGCRVRYRRARFQEELERLNPGWTAAAAPAAVRPDGDVELERADYAAFRVPECPRCGGRFKPWVVFFGESIPRGRTARAMARLEEADALLVAGSSLTVGSGYRFARSAARRGVPIALVNLGATRADAEAALKVEAGCGETLAHVANELGVP